MADLCAQEEIPFVLGHALYMKAIHGAKAKNDKIGSRKVAALLRGGLLPQAYAYSRGPEAGFPDLCPFPEPEPNGRRATRACAQVHLS